MKRPLIFIIVLFSISFLKAQIRLPAYPDSSFSTYYHQRWALFKSLPYTNDDIIIIGNSITDGGEWSELFNDLHVKAPVGSFKGKDWQNPVKWMFTFVSTDE